MAYIGFSSLKAVDYCICIIAYVLRHFYMHMCIYMNTYIDMCVYVNVCVYVCVYVWVNVCIYIYVCVCMYMYLSKESLEVKLPTIWTDEKPRWEESERREE